MDNTQIILNELKSISKRLDEQSTAIKGLEQGQKNLEKGQAQLHTAVAQNTTMIEALKEGQDSSTAAIRADIQDLGSKMAKNKKKTDIRLDALDEYIGHHNPIKH